MRFLWLSSNTEAQDQWCLEQYNLEAFQVYAFRQMICLPVPAYYYIMKSCAKHKRMWMSSSVRFESEEAPSGP
jgi:hypothetical protein